jgi:hypothetical protein
MNAAFYDITPLLPSLAVANQNIHVQVVAKLHQSIHGQVNWRA